jgi:hypothetical protein
LGSSAKQVDSNVSKIVTITSNESPIYYSFFAGTVQKIVVLVKRVSSISQIQLIAHPMNTIVDPFSKSDPVILII